MGCGPSKIEGGDKVAHSQNAKIERMIRDDKKVEARTIKILLLGIMLQAFHWLSYSNQTSVTRCWRVRQIDHHQADANHTLQRLPSR